MRALFPPGFRALAALGVSLLAIGLAQLAALFVRDEPYPLSAAALALLLAAGGAVLIAFIHHNRGAAQSAPTPADLLTFSAFALVAGLSVYLLGSTGIFFPFRMTLLWRSAAPAEPALPMMIAGTALVTLGALATAVLSGALWAFMYARRIRTRAATAALSFAGAIPYVAFALVIRALLCRPVAFLAAGRSLSLRPDEELAYRSMLGLAPGVLAASLSLGLASARGLWSWLEDVRAREEASESFLMARLRGQRPWQIVLRQGVFLRRRRDLGALLLGGMAAAALIDVLSNTLIDSFRPPGFPPYPTLGAALFLRGLASSGAPLEMPFAWSAAHVALVLAALILLLAQTLPRGAGRIALRRGELSVGATVLLRGAASAHGLAPRPALQWVLGPSGSGKSTLLRAWSAELRDAVLVPQDPDDALAPALSGVDLARLAAKAQPRGDLVLWDLLGRLGDERIRRRLFDPFTSVFAFSRGERQRLCACLALSRARGDRDCTLLFDEPTSGQDALRTHAFFDCLRELLPARFEGRGSAVITSHDPESLAALLGDRGAHAVADHVLWMENGRAHRFTVEGARWEGGAQPAGLARYLDAAREMMNARDAACAEQIPAPAEGVQLWRSRLEVGGRPHAISPEARVRGGELIVLCGPSGAGKTTLLRAIAERRPASVEIGYVPQDPARAFPAEMPVGEVLGAQHGADLLRHWFGEGLSPMRARPVSALSEGERHRVVLASEVLRLSRAAARLQVLLLDEPFGALDPAAHLRLMDALLRWLRESPRRSAVLVSHSPLVDLGLSRAFGVPTCEWSMGAA